MAGLRERKKRDTYRALSDAARQLVRDRGLEHVTVDDIAAAAGVSVRTFFNYFASKEEAVVGMEADLLAELADEVRRRPAAESPVAVLRAVLLPDGDTAAALRRWRLRNELVRRYPALLPGHLATIHRAEEALARAVADRAGIDPAADPGPRVFVAATLAALRGAVTWWEESDRSLPLDAVVDAALHHVAPHFARNR